MSNKVAIPIIKNKFWVVEDEGTKVATIQAKDGGGVVYVHDDSREHYPSIKLLSKQHNITIDKLKNTKNKSTNFVYQYPTSNKPFNQLYDVKRKLPVFTKTSKSKSYYCAGYYLIKQHDKWEEVFCPKLISLNRHNFLGPFQTKEEALLYLRTHNGK